MKKISQHLNKIIDKGESSLVSKMIIDKLEIFNSVEYILIKFIPLIFFYDYYLFQDNMKKKKKITLFMLYSCP